MVKWSITILIFSLMACKDRGNASDLLHKENEPLQYSEKWTHVSVSEADFTRVVVGNGYLKGSTFLPLTDEVPQRLQYWVHKIHESVLKTMPEQGRNVPEPKVRVVVSPVLAAFAVPILACVKTNFIINETADRSKTARGVMFFQSLLTYGSVNADAQPCVEVADSQTLQSLVDTINSRGDRCHLRLDASQNTIHPENCYFYPDVASNYSAEKLYFYATADQVILNLGFVKKFEEAELIAVLAHELGHYYRSHIVAFPGDYDFFYAMGEHNHAEKPKADPNLVALGKEVQQVSKFLTSEDSVIRIENQKVHSGLYFLLSSLVLDLATRDGTNEFCRNAAALIKAQSFQDSMKYFPIGAFSDRMAEKYGEFERLALSCFAPVGVSTVTPAKIRAYLETPIYPLWFRSSEPGFLRDVATSVITMVKEASEPLPENDRLDDFILRLSSRIAEVKAERLVPVKKAFDQHLGYYTAEQEADELGVEFLSDVGLEPSSLSKALKRLGFNKGTTQAGFFLNEKDCANLIADGWRDADKNPVFAPIGDYTWQHHSVCFRIFNVTREIDIHQYPSKTAPVPPGKNWQQLQTYASTLLPAATLALTDTVIVRQAKFSSTELDRSQKLCTFSAGEYLSFPR